ncbi:hypothetical protein COL922a_005486 [Colletotrichum nupharicola]|nr:hypothetical protein COL922a_005486 [Colletotrichum nupharicola]
MLVAIADWPKLVRNVFKYLNPVGWAEFQDLNSEYYSDDGTYTEEHATRKWNKQFVDAWQTKDEVLVMLAKVRQEIKSNALHAMFDHHVVYGKKPEDQTEESDEE